MKKILAVLFACSIVLAGCMDLTDEDIDAIVDAIVEIPGCNADENAYNYDVNATNNNACLTETILKQSVTDFVNLIDEGPAWGETMGIVTEGSETDSDGATTSFTTTVAMSPDGMYTMIEMDMGMMDIEIGELMTENADGTTNIQTTWMGNTYQMNTEAMFDDHWNEQYFLEDKDNEGDTDDGMDDDMDMDLGLPDTDVSVPEDFDPATALYAAGLSTSTGYSFTTNLEHDVDHTTSMTFTLSLDLTVTNLVMVETYDGMTTTSSINMLDADAAGLLLVNDVTLMEFALPFTLAPMGGHDSGDSNDGEDMFLCDNGDEVPMHWVNDGMDDCGDGSDETNHSDDGHDDHSDDGHDDHSDDGHDGHDDHSDDGHDDHSEDGHDDGMDDDGMDDDDSSDDGESDLFTAADSDNDGLVTTSDIVNAILSMDAPTPQDALDQGDMDQSDSISWDEFVQLWNMEEDESDADDQHLNNNPQLESDFHAAFNNSDTNYDGNLSIDELQSFIDDVATLSSTQEEITEMTTIFAPYVACVDGNSDGSLDQVEFSDFYGAVMYGMENSELVFCTLDSNQDGTVTVHEYVDFINQTGMYSEEYPMTEEDWEGFTSLIGMYDTDDVEGLSLTEYQSFMEDISPSGGGDWEPYYGGYCEWEGDPTDDDNVWSCKDDESDTEWDTWWYYCELHGEDWFCTDDYGQSPDWEYSATGTLYQDNGDDGDHTDDGHNDHADHGMAYDWVIQSADMMSETELIGAFADYEIVLANCAETDSDDMMGTTELDCGEDVMKVTMADANVSGAQIMFHDADMSGTITVGDMIHIDPDIDAGGEWNTVRLYSASTQTYSDENPMLPGFGAAAGLIALLGAALLTRRD